MAFFDKQRNPRMKDFKDKVVVITGGATGIGFSFAKRFGQEGAAVVIAGRRQDRLEQAVRALADLGIAAQQVGCDVAKAGDIEALADIAWDAFGHVDVLVNNAGMGLARHTVVDTPDDALRHIFDVNFFGLWRGCAVFGKRFIAQATPAAIYNVGSENSLFNAVPLSAAYIATKHAVLALTEALREEMPDFIDVGLICPGFVRSELGDPAVMAMGMDTDTYTAIAMEQIKAGAFFIVSHAYNMVRIDARHGQIADAYARYAPRYDGDDEFDARSLIAKPRGGTA